MIKLSFVILGLHLLYFFFVCFLLLQIFIDWYFIDFYTDMVTLTDAGMSHES